MQLIWDKPKCPYQTGCPDFRGVHIKGATLFTIIVNVRGVDTVC